MNPSEIERQDIVLGRQYQDTLTGVVGTATKHCRNYGSPDTALLEWKVGKAISKDWLIVQRLQEVAQ